MIVDHDFYVNVVELMTDIVLDRSETLSELPIIKVSGSDVIYYEEVSY